MKGYLNFENLELSRHDSRELLQILVYRAERQYLLHCLKIFNVPNRTQIYKDFGPVFKRAEYLRFRADLTKLTMLMEARQARKPDHLEAILNCTTIQQWLAAYSQWYSISRLISFISAAGIEITTVPVYLADQNQQPYYVQNS